MPTFLAVFAAFGIVFLKNEIASASRLCDRINASASDFRKWYLRKQASPAEF